MTESQNKVEKTFSCSFAIKFSKFSNAKMLQFDWIQEKFVETFRLRSLYFEILSYSVNIVTNLNNFWNLKTTRYT